LAAVAAVSFSLRSIFVKLAYEDMHDPVTLLALRMIFALPFFVIALAIIIGLQIGSSSRQISSRDIALLLGLGFVGYYLSSLLDMIGLQFVSAGVGRLLLFVYPTIVVIISAIALGKKPARKEVAALAITYVGVSLVLSNNYGGNSDDFWLGAMIIMASAVSFSFTWLGAERLFSRVGTVRFYRICNHGRVHVLHPAFPGVPPLQRSGTPNAGLYTCRCNVGFQHGHADLHDG